MGHENEQQLAPADVWQQLAVGFAAVSEAPGLSPWERWFYKLQCRRYDRKSIRKNNKARRRLQQAERGKLLAELEYERALACVAAQSGR